MRIDHFPKIEKTRISGQIFRLAQISIHSMDLYALTEAIGHQEERPESSVFEVGLSGLFYLTTTLGDQVFLTAE